MKGNWRPVLVGAVAGALLGALGGWLFGGRGAKEGRIVKAVERDKVIRLLMAAVGIVRQMVEL